MKKIKVEFTREQFLEMMKLVCLGESVLNGHKLYEDFDKKAEELQDFIVKEAVKNNVKDYLFNFKPSKEFNIEGGYDIDNEVSMEFFELLEESHKESFSEEIVEIVSRNEVFLKYTDEEFDNIEDKEKVFSDMIKKVDNEFIENGYENLKINWKNKNPLFAK